MKNFIVILLILICPICVWGQGSEAKKLLEQGKDLFNDEKYEEAIPFFEKCERLEGNISTIKIESVDLLSQCYKRLNNYTEALKYDYQISEIFKELSGEEHTLYANALNNLAIDYYNLGNYQEAIKLGTRTKEIRQKVLGEGHPDYASALDNLSSYYSATGNYQEAIRLDTQALEIEKKVFGEDNSDYAMSLNNLASKYANIGNYQEAIRLGTQAIEIIKKNLGEEHLDYAMLLHNMATYYTDLGNYQEAIKLNNRALEIHRKVVGKEDLDYAMILNSLATNYQRLGNNEEALRLSTQVMEIRQKVLGEEHPNYGSTLNSLATTYQQLGNNEEALRLSTQAMEIDQKGLGEEHPDYAMSLNNLATKYADLGNYQEAIRLTTQALEIFKKTLGEEHPNYAMALSNLANLNSQLGDYEEAIRFGLEASSIRKKVFGEEHPDYSMSLYNLAGYYFDAEQSEEATMYITQTYNIYETLVLKTFAYLTNKERPEFWNKYSDFFNNKMPYFATVEPNSTLIDFALNGQLLSKGLLLNADIEIQNLIEKQGNEQLKALFNKIRQDRKTLDELYQLPIDKRTMNADSLAKVIDNEEHHLVESCQEIGDYTKNLSIKWTDVQQHLKDNDIAIEFTYFNSNKPYYIALVLKKGMSAPELVRLASFETDAVDYQTSDLYNRIWEPLEGYLQGVQNVYFSPTGKFHTIGIEYLSDDNGEIFAKKYNAYRLSSTRELALNHTVNQNKKASVFGGIVYDFDETDWQNVSEEEAERAGISFLKGAKKESEEITNILSENSFNVEYGTDKAATEESFKKLSGSGIKILHIATHGFYEPESKEKSFADLLSSDDEHSQEDLSLSRSGLFFAGANTALDPEQRKYIPDGVDDGILTAKEISRMDFKGLDLVVMSACQTGLGEVTSEGVFGLQRGFKKAGAQTIIMSLWNVSDKPTRELMTEFYRNLVAGKTKREAFILAQDKIRLKYIDPKMWAGFIMVDGIE